MRETYECLKTLSQNGLFCNFHYKMKCFDENERRFYIRYVGSALLCAVFKINSDSYEIIWRTYACLTIYQPVLLKSSNIHVSLHFHLSNVIIFKTSIWKVSRLTIFSDSTRTLVFPCSFGYFRLSRMPVIFKNISKDRYWYVISSGYQKIYLLKREQN